MVKKFDIIYSNCSIYIANYVNLNTDITFTIINSLIVHSSESHLSVGVDRGSGKVAVISRAEGAAGSDLSAVDVRDTEPGDLLALVDSDDSVSGSGLSDISPRDGQVRSGGAGLVGPALTGGVLARHADDGAALSLAISSDSEVVVAAGIALTAVAGQIRDGPGLARDKLGV